MFTPDVRLQKLYEKYNLLYFDNELPPDVAVGWMDFPKRDPLADTGTLDSDGIIHHQIYINEFLKPFRGAITKWILLHEMGHIKLHPYSKHDRKRFDAEMIRLAQAGAFHHIW